MMRADLNELGCNVEQFCLRARECEAEYRACVRAVEQGGNGEAWQCASSISMRLQEAINQLTSDNTSREMEEFKEIYDGSAMVDIRALASALDAWSRTMSAIHQAYHKARCDSCQEVLNALNRIN